MLRNLLFLCLLPAAVLAQPPAKIGPHALKDPDRYFRPDGIEALSDRAVGLLDKGQVGDLVTNYGILADFHLGAPALHWPRNGSDVQHYGFGVGLILVADGTVISSIYDPSSAALDFGWEAADGSAGTHYNATRTPANTAGDGVTPFLAFSDIRDTWPLVNGQPAWPGDFRLNLEDSLQGQVAGEFVSDRDVFAVVRDDYGLGLVLEQTAYTYGRPYAEDFFFVRCRLINQGTVGYDSCYIGSQADLRPDHYADDLINSWAMEPYDQTPSFFYKWDYNGVAQRIDSSHFDDLWTGPVARVGVGMVDTPNGLGVTSFHYYHDDNSPVEDAYFAALLANDAQAPLEGMDRYFHGADPAFDDPALWTQVDTDSMPGAKITFLFGSGPFSLAPGDSVDFALIFALGATEADLRDNVEMAYYMAKERAYQGSGPPALPALTAIPGDGRVTLVWDSRAEASVDVISGQADFEGYRLYKSADRGLTWGDPVTNFYGETVGWVPLAQFDLVDGVTGLDPAYGPAFPNANQWLGDDTGIQHFFADEDAVNGQEVWYCLTAYDRGVFDPGDPSLTEPSYENSIGASPYDVNVAVVTPGTAASNLQPGSGGPFVEVGGRVADGQLDLLVVDPAALLDHTYRITFNDPGDTVVVGSDTLVADTLTLNLEDLTAGTGWFTDALTGETFPYVNFPLSGDGQPVVNGFRLVVSNIAGAGLRTLGWTTVQGDSSTFDWWTGDRHPGNSSSYAEVIEGLDDWRVTVTADCVWAPVIAAGFGTEPEDSFRVPLQVERAVYETGGEWVDATPYLMISDLQLVFPGSPSVGPLGWDLTPGGLGYNPNANTGTLWPDLLILRDDGDDSTGSLIYLKTQNGPAEARPPSVGDVFTLETYKPFNGQLVYEFTTQGMADAPQGPDLSQIKVVPNPLIVSSGLESNPYESKVMFTHLPAPCDITIYTVSGNEVARLHHEGSGGEGFTFWDTRNHHGQNVAYGLYVYVVKTPSGATFTGKLMVIR
ncbi:MAG: hypothetical protein C4524_09525 [Candidatus Zixiibacteriota bacterium]|nr:MAG: hypothetical protein C4524_09525 [candidate division Zixibacteria bacterium]